MSTFLKKKKLELIFDRNMVKDATFGPVVLPQKKMYTDKKKTYVVKRIACSFRLESEIIYRHKL